MMVVADESELGSYPRRPELPTRSRRARPPAATPKNRHAGRHSTANAAGPTFFRGPTLATSAPELGLW